jgi:tRNA threonylcarbamoyladenosine biosynthesis protein TsaB
MGTATLSRARAHAREFLAVIDALCRFHAVAPASIAEVYVSSGPGSFTGLRIGVTAAKMLALATGARVVAVPTLEVIAQNALDATPRPDRVAVVLDAKRGHVYAAAFDWDGSAFVQATAAVEAEPLEFLSSQPAECAVLGEGVLYHRESIAKAQRRVLSEAIFPPRPETVYALGYAEARRGRFTDRRNLIPTYIRPPEAEEVWKRKQTSDAATKRRSDEG